MTLSLDTTVAHIKQWHRRRVFMMKQRMRNDLALGAFVRTEFGWRKIPEDMTKEEKAAQEAANKLAMKRADAILEMGEAAAVVARLSIKEDRTKAEERALEKARVNADSDEPEFQRLRGMMIASIAAREPFDADEELATKELERLAKSLPVWERCEDILGFSARSLATVVGEAGDLANYPKKGHLWKRMGVAVMDGVRQGGLTKGATKQDWIDHGYNKARRSRMFVIGDTILKAQIRVVKDAAGEDTGERTALGAYGALYLERKQYERAQAEASGRQVVPAAKIKGRHEEFMSEGQVHRRAARYVEKRLLRNLWQAWNADRKAMPRVPERAIDVVPTDQLSTAAQKKAA